VKGRADPAHFFNFPTVQSPRTGYQSDRVCASENEILRVSGRNSDTTSDIVSREAEENTTVGTPPPLSTKGLSERHSKVHGESLCIHKSKMATSPTLQSTAISDKLSGTREPESNRTSNCEI